MYVESSPYKDGASAAYAPFKVLCLTTLPDFTFFVVR